MKEARVRVEKDAAEAPAECTMVKETGMFASNRRWHDWLERAEVARDEADVANQEAQKEPEPDPGSGPLFKVVPDGEPNHVAPNHVAPTTLHQDESAEDRLHHSSLAGTRWLGRCHVRARDS